MDMRDLALRIYAASHLTGAFTLRSGKVSGEYFDKYRFESDPALLSVIAKAMAPLIPAGTEVLAGLEMGGIPVVTALSLETGLPAAYVRKAAKAYGTCKQAEGPDLSGRKVCVVEDVVTSGGAVIDSLGGLRGAGAVVVGAVCVILRDPEAVGALKAHGVRLCPALTMGYIKGCLPTGLERP